MNNCVFIKNREKLMNQIDDNSILIAFAGKAPKKTGDELYQFTCLLYTSRWPALKDRVCMYLN